MLKKRESFEPWSRELRTASHVAPVAPPIKRWCQLLTPDVYFIGIFAEAMDQAL